MTNELTPVRCGCGGEAKVDCVIQHDGLYMAGVFCANCGTKTIPFWSKEKDKAIDYAVTTWNKAMGATDIHVGDKFAKDINVPNKERTAKVEQIPDEEGTVWDVCECGMDVYRAWTYCPNCGARLEWNE